MSLSLDEFYEMSSLRFHEAAIRIHQTFPDVNIGVEKGKRFPLHLSALILNASEDDPDNVALGISLYDEVRGNYLVGAKSTANAKLIDVDVCWGHPSPHIDGSFAAGPVPINEANLQKIYDDLPRLIAILESALRRKRPAEGDPLTAEAP